MATGAAASGLRVLTYNIRYAASGDRGERNWNHRKKTVIKVIRANRPDVLGVQEALAGQMEDPAKGLPEYPWVGAGRDDGKRKGEFSALFFRKERFTVADGGHGTFWLSATPEVAGSKSFGNKNVRICTWAHLSDADTKQSLYIYNTHWDHQHQGSREASARLILKQVRNRAHKDTPVIVMGDFNATEDNPAVALLLGGAPRKETSFRESFLLLHPEEANRRTFNGWTGRKDGKALIDHILVSPAWTVKKAWIDRTSEGETWPSDHFPVGAVLE